MVVLETQPQYFDLSIPTFIRFNCGLDIVWFVNKLLVSFRLLTYIQHKESFMVYQTVIALKVMLLICIPRHLSCLLGSVQVMSYLCMKWQSEKSLLFFCKWKSLLKEKKSYLILQTVFYGSFILLPVSYYIKFICIIQVGDIWSSYLWNLVSAMGKKKLKICKALCIKCAL